MSIEAAPQISDEKPKELAPTTGELDVIVNGPEAAQETAQFEAPQSRLARFLQRASETAQGLGDKLSESAANQQDRFEREAIFDTYADNIDATRSRERQEKLDAAKGILKRFGRSALSLPRRAYLETQVQVAVGKEVARDARDATVNALNKGKDTILKGADFIADNVNAGIDAAKEKANEVKDVIIEGADYITDTVNDGIDRGKAFVVGEYTAVKDAIAEKRDDLREFFMARKAAAIARKERRIAQRLETREINKRTVNVETQRRLAERNARRTGKIALSATLTEKEA